MTLTDTLATADHKRVGLLFLGGAALFLVAGGVVGMVIRAELLDSGVEVVGGNFDRLFSFHATMAGVLFLGPAWLGLALFVVPLQIGSSGVAFPRMAAFSGWLYLVGGGVLVASYLIDAPVGLGLTSSLPIPAPPGGANQATSLWIAGLGVVAVAMVLGALSVAVTVLKLRTEGLTLLRVPMFTLASFLTAVGTLLATPVFLAGLSLVYIDQTFGGSFFGPSNAAGPAVWQHTVWLFGRPDVLLLALPGLGAACDLVATHARRPLINLDAARAGLIGFTVLSFTVWAAGTDVADAIVLPTPTILSALIAAPAGVLVLVWLGTLAKGRPRPHVSLLLVTGAVVLAGVGALHAAIAGAVDVEGPEWAIGHVHTVAFGAPTLLLAAALFHWAPKLFGRQLSAGLGGVAFLALFGGFLLMGLGEYLLGYDDAPARIKDYAFTENGSTFSAIAGVGAVLLVLGILAVGLDVVRALAGRGAEADDPYDGLTLEWATASPPPAHNFDAVPEVRSAHPLLDLREAELTSGG